MLRNKNREFDISALTDFLNNAYLPQTYMYIEELSRKYRADHFLSYILRSVLKTCWNYRGQTVLEYDFGTKDGGPFLTLRFKVRLEI